MTSRYISWSKNLITACLLSVIMCASRVYSIALSYYLYSKPARILFQALVYRDGNLVSGSLEALVQHMVPTEEYYPDRAYLFAFLLSARLFIKPHELLGEVCALCEHQQNLNGEGGKVSNRVYSRTSTKPFFNRHRGTHSRESRVLSFHRARDDPFLFACILPSFFDSSY